jgi:hypothetical protein
VPFSESTLPALIFTLSIQGSVGSWVDMTVDNGLADEQATLLIGMRGKHYDAAAPVFIHSADMEPNSSSSVSVRTTGTAGAYGSGNNVIKSVGGVSETATPDILALIEGLPHRGSYRAFVRCRANGADTSINLAWSSAAPGFSNNAPVHLPANTWVLADCGIVPFTTKKNFPTGRIFIDGQATGSSQDIEINYLLLLPIDDGYAELTGPIPPNGSATISRSVVTVNDGTDTVTVVSFIGDYPYLEQYEGRPIEVTLKAAVGAREGNIIEDPYPAVDLTATLRYSPRHFVVPEPQ